MNAPSPPFLRLNAAAHPVALSGRALEIVILSEVRFLRESLSEILGRDPGIAILGHYALLGEALDETMTRRPDVFLLDAAFIGGTSTVRRIREAAPEIRVVAFAVIETEDNVVAWAEAGVAGYVPSTAALAELTTLLHDISNGRQPCSAHVAAGLLRRIASNATRAYVYPPSAAPLTTREAEILHLIDAGLSNKDIARRLVISLATTKSHVHNLLAKLNVQRRGQAAARVRQQAREPVRPGP